MSVGKLKLKGVAMAGTSCLWTPLDPEGLKDSESAVTVVAGDDGVITLDASPKTIWYVLECNRTGYPDEPVEPVEPAYTSSSLKYDSSNPSSSSSFGPSKDGSSCLKVSWALMMALAFVCIQMMI